MEQKQRERFFGRFPILCILLSTLALILIGCNYDQLGDSWVVENAAATAVVVSTTPDALAAVTTETAVPLSPSPLPSLTPSATHTARVTSPPTETATPTPTSAPEHPLMIEVMRRDSYPGSELLIERTLEAGENYGRYVASYLSEGNKIYGLLTVPRGLKPESGWPVILFNHGYVPPDEYRTTERYLDYIDYLASNGYIVFRSDYRGHGNSEGRAGGAYGTPNYTIDVLNAMAAVKTHPEADPARIGMWGHSMGGHITLRAMVVSNEVKAGVIWSGVVGPFPDLFAHSVISESAAGFVPRPTPSSTRWPTRWRDSLFATYGSPEENPAFWDSISANAYLEEISGPLQLHHATTDEIVPVAVSELLQGQMESVGKPSELYLYDGDNHNIAVNFYTAMGRSLEFFDSHVKGAYP